MKFNKAKFLADLKHTWKFHKISSISYIASFGVFVLLVYMGGQIIKWKVALPDYLISGIVVILFGFTMFQLYNRMARFVESDESAKPEHQIDSGKQTEVSQ